MNKYNHDNKEFKKTKNISVHISLYMLFAYINYKCVGRLHGLLSIAKINRCHCLLFTFYRL